MNRAALLRLAGWVALAAVVAGVTSTLLYLRLRPATIEGRGPQPSGAVVSGNVAAAQKALASVVRISTGPAPSPSAGQPVDIGPGGSGVVVDDRGFILTAEQVIAGAQEISVAAPGGKSGSARVIGSDHVSGLSLLKVDVTGLQPIDASGGAALAPGSGVVVAAAPPGPQVMLGGVAGVGVSTTTPDPASPGQRRVLNDLVALDVTQRDSTLGAAVVDGNGRLVGLVVANGGGTWASAYSDFSAGLQQLIESGRVTYPWLDYTYQDLSLAAAAGRGVGAGALVLAVTPGSRAATAGLVAGDIVTAVNGNNLDAQRTLRRALKDLASGQDATLAVRAPDGSSRNITIPVTVETP